MNATEDGAPLGEYPEVVWPPNVTLISSGGSGAVAIAAFDATVAELANLREAVAELAHFRRIVQLVTEAMDAWEMEGLGTCPELEFTNWPDAWADVRQALKGYAL